MRFEDFARMHGLVFNSIIPHKWVSTPTVDHPRSGNGRYKFMGDVGWVQNWATMEKPAIWKTDEIYHPTAEIKRAKSQAIAERDALPKWRQRGFFGFAFDLHVIGFGQFVPRIGNAMLFAAVIGATLLKERLGAWRIAGAATIAAGMAMLRL